MGGYGSTRWGWHCKKQTVEDSLKLSITDFSKRLSRFDSPYRNGGVLLWKRGEQITGSIGYSITRQGDSPIITLEYRCQEQPVKCPVSLTTTPCHFGGVRWWFKCPYCQRRVGCLYLAPGTRRFACRVCHDLTYESSQEAHQFDSLGYVLGMNHKRLNALMAHQRLTHKWLNGERLTRWEKRKLKAGWAGMGAR